MTSPSSPVRMLKKIRVVTLILSVMGIGLSGYSSYVSYRKEANNEYRAFCDINENMSCSKVFTSKYGKGFGFLDTLLGKDSPAIVSNGIYGIIFYCLVALLGELTSVVAAHLQRFIVLLTNVLSVYLAYILFFVLKDVCVVCISTYAINFLLAICCFIRVSYLSSLRSKKKPSSKSSTNAKTQNSNKNQTPKNQTPKNTPNANKNKENAKNIQDKDKETAKNIQNVNKAQQNNAKNIQNATKNIQNNNKNIQNAIKKPNPNKNAQITNKNNQNSNKSNTKNSSNSNKGSKKKN